MESKQNLPAGWRWVKLGEVCKFEYGSGLPERDRIKGSVPVFGSNGIVGYHNVGITKGQTIIIGRKGSIGQVNFSETSCWPIDTTYFIDSTKTRCDLIWLFWLLNWLRLDLLNKATGVPGLNREDAYKQLIPLPPLSEQKRIAAKLKEMMNEIDNARLACEKQLEAAKTLPSAYLREVFESPAAHNWPKKKLGEVCEVLGGDPAPQDEVYFKNGTFPFVRMQDLGRYHQTDNLIKTTDKVNQLAVNQLNFRIFKKGSVLLPRSGSVYTNHRAVLGVDACVVSHIAILQCNNYTDPYYIYYYLCTFDMNQISSYTTGLDLLTFKDLKEIETPLPPLSEQKRIAEYLKEKITQAEKLKAAIEKELATINSLPQSILSKAFKGEL